MREDKKINTKNINEMTCVGTKILKILYFLIIVLAIYVLTLVNKEWGVFKFIWSIVKVISPLFIGILIAYLFNPLIVRMTNKGKMNRAVATSIVYIVLVAIIYLFCSYLFPLIGRELNDLIKYLPTVFDSVNEFVTNILKKLNIDTLKADKALNIKTILTSSLTSLTTNMPTKVFATLSTILSKLGVLLLSLIISFYLLIDFDRAQENIYIFIPEKYRKSTHTLLSNISEQVFSFVRGTGFIALLVFAVSAISFGFAGLRAAVFFALWNAITNIIPYIGPYIGGIPIVAVAFATDYKLGIAILIVVLLIQLIESYILHPIVMSKTMKLHPVTIIIGLLVFGHFFGIIGMVIATPVTAILKTIWLFIDDKYKITEKLERKNSFDEE
ncbi:MAG: AI-2E family transporter [Bacilli bacterium]|nr:AI-2E family transporter [Bacilli bacterium]